MKRECSTSDRNHKLSQHNFHKKQKVFSKPEAKEKEEQEGKSKQSEGWRNRKTFKSKRKPTDTIISSSKTFFEELRRSNCPQSRKLEIIRKLSTLLKGSLAKFVRRHEMSRIIQWMIKLGTQETHEFIVEELRDIIPDLVKRKYSYYVVVSLIKYTVPTLRRKVITILISDDILPLLNCKISAGLLDKVYKMYARPEQKSKILQSISGKVCSGLDLSATFSTICVLNKELAPAILSATKSNLTKLIEKEWCVRSHIVGDILQEYLKVCNPSDRLEMYEMLKPHVKDLINTYKGCNVSIDIMWIATPKEKKVIIKSIQDDLIGLAKTKPGSFFILSLFDTVDDTVLLKKAVLSKITEDILNIIGHAYARRILIYLFLHHNATATFSPAEFDVLTCHAVSEHIKKSSKQRLNELRDGCVQKLVRCIKDTPGVWFNSTPVSLLTAALFEYASETQLDIENDIKGAFMSISNYVINNNTQILQRNNTLADIVEDANFHVIMKNIIRSDCNRFSKNLVTFSVCLARNLTKSSISKWLLTNRGCFTIVVLLESGVDPVIRIIKDFLEDEDIRDLLSNQNTSGARLLNAKFLQIE